MPTETKEHLLSVIKTELADLLLSDFTDEGELQTAENSAYRLLDAIRKLKEGRYSE